MTFSGSGIKGMKAKMGMNCSQETVLIGYAVMRGQLHVSMC